MWNPDIAPTLSLPDLAKTLGMSVEATKAMVKEQDRLRDAEAERVELKAAERRYKQGPRKVNEELGDMVPEVSMSRWRWLQLYRASLTQKGCKGGEYLADDDFVKWMLKRVEKLRIQVACAKNRTGWLPTVERAKEWGEKERSGRAVLDPATGGWKA